MRLWIIAALCCAASGQTSIQQNYDARAYNWTRTNGAGASGNLSSAGAVTVTVTPCPKGAVLAGSYASPIYISGGTGTAEAVSPTGGTCTVGAPTGTIIFTTLQAHSGAWVLRSASAGIHEAASAALNGNGGTVAIPAGSYSVYSAISLNVTGNKALHITGTGYGISSGTAITNLGTGNLFSFTSDSSDLELSLSDLALYGALTTGHAVACTSCSGLRMDRVYANSHGGDGVHCTDCFGATIDHSFFLNNGGYGIWCGGACNAFTVSNTAAGQNCRLSASCGGLAIATGGQAVTVRDSRFEGNGAFPGGVSVTFSAGALISGVKGLIWQGNYCERNVTHCLYLGGGVSGYSVSGSYFQDSGVFVDTAVHGSIRDSNFVVSANAAKTISGVVGGTASRCRYTATAAHGLTATAFVNVTGVGGATACNGYSTVAAVISSTVFETSLGFSGSYTSGGSVIQATGYVVGTAGDADFRATGNDLSNANTYVTGGDLMPGIGAAIASASSIAPTNLSHHVTGTAAVNSIAAPTGFSGKGFCAIPDAVFTTTNIGNIALASTAVVGKQLCWTYDTGTSKWYPNY